MKNLSNYCIEVLNDFERQVALKFYRLATHKKSGSVKSGNFVGLNLGKEVVCGEYPLPRETVIHFFQLSTLADTDSRWKAYKKCFRKSHTNDYAKPTSITVGKPPHQVKFISDGSNSKPSTDKVTPNVTVVKFLYTHDGKSKIHYVQLISLNDTYLTGLDLSDSRPSGLKYQFKKFIRSRISGHIQLFSYGTKKLKFTKLYYNQ